MAATTVQGIIRRLGAQRARTFIGDYISARAADLNTAGMITYLETTWSNRVEQITLAERAVAEYNRQEATGSGDWKD